MKQIGGDIIKYQELPGGRIFIGLADASGHGIPATLIALKFIDYFKKVTARLSDSPGKDPAEIMNEVLNDLNNEIVEETPGDSYLTAVLMVIDSKKEKVYLVNAAHPPVFQCKSQGGEIQRMDSTRGTIGLFIETPEELSEHNAASHVTAYDTNDTFLLYSDGITEAQNQTGEMLTISGLENIFHSHASLKPEKLIDHVIDEVTHFTGQQNDVFDDDLSLLAIKLHKE